MRALPCALGLLLLGALRAFPQDRALKATCAGDPDHSYDEAAGRCCYRCPWGLSPTRRCPQRSADCRKRCEPDYYVNRDGRCTACVSCSGDDLVEKAPCSWNSSRVCACRPGMFCATSATNSCARCSQHSVCAPGTVVKSPGTAEKDTVCELPSPRTSPDCASPGDCETPASRTLPQAKPTQMPPATSEARTTLLRGDAPGTPEDASRLTRAPQPPSSVGKPSPDPGIAGRDDTSEPPPWGTHPHRGTPENSQTPASSAPTLSPLGDFPTSRTSSISTVSLSSTGKPILDPGPVLFWVSLAVVLAVGFSSFLLCHLKACRRRIRQKVHLCYPGQTFRPKQEPVDSRIKTLTQSSSTTDLSPASPRAVETSVSVGAACPERLPLLDPGPAGPSAPRDAREPRVSTEHTNNKIEKVYIMKADTVIVGTVKAEAPDALGLVGPEVEAELEVDYAPHYPEQETEPPLGSCGDIMFSVEEEGKTDPWPMTASEE